MARRKPMTVTLSDEVKAMLKRLAAAEGRSQSNLLEQLVIGHNKESERKPDAGDSHANN